MKPVYIDSQMPEKLAKQKFHFKEGIMMENAASSLETSLMKIENLNGVLILCGGGNNGGDGLALARRIFGEINCIVCMYACPKTEEAVLQYEMAKAVGVQFIEPIELFEKYDDEETFIRNFSVVVDCIYGTGFHGELPCEVVKTFQLINKLNVYKIACDIPSGIDKNGNIHTTDDSGNEIAFCADETVTMGALKLALFSDFSKDYTGSITVTNLGISKSSFVSCGKPDLYLIENTDTKLPFRTKKNTHKGNYGHLAVVTGDKPGAGIIAGTAALRFGTGLVSCINKNDISGNFMMNPELMVQSEIPEKANCVLIGSGLGRGENAENIVDYVFKEIKTKMITNVVLDADFFYSKKLFDILTELNANDKISVILTPHLKEFYELLKACKIIEDTNFINFLENRYEYIQKFSEKFQNVVLVSKGANTFISRGKEKFVCDAGTQALSKAGSGDVLAGLCAALLSQGYDAVDACKTAVYSHGFASSRFEDNYALSPLKLIEKLD